MSFTRLWWPGVLAMAENACALSGGPVSDEERIPDRVARLCEVLADHPDGMTRAALAEELQRRYRVPAARVPALVAEAGARVVVQGDLIQLAQSPAPTTPV